MRRAYRGFVVLLVGLGSAWLCAQYQVNPQIGAVNNQLYGGGSSGSVKYARGSQSRPMRSELRYAYRQSGALPSDIRMGQAKLGSLHPSGPQAYIPERPSYTQQSKPQKYVAPQGSRAFSSGSVKHSSTYSSSAYSVKPSSAMGAKSVSTPSYTSKSISPSSLNGGSVRYQKY